MFHTAALLLALSAAPRDSVADLCARFSGFDHDGDGVPELARLTPLSSAGDAGPRVLVLVEDRVLAAQPDAVDLTPALARLVEDLGREGYRAHALAVELGHSGRHQDGRTVLALREVLRAAAAESELAGALLVGHFPDAYVVRTCNWRRDDDVTLRDGATYRGAPWVRRVPEDVAHRCDLVLADLDGRWEDVYVEPRTRLETVLAVFPDGLPASGGPCADLKRGSVTYQDFFHVSDGKLEVSERVGPDGQPVGWSVFLDDRAGDHECSDADRALPNVMAHPDVLVSRIDARGVALRPRADVRGVDGEGLLDDAGRPRAVRFADEGAVPSWHDGIWEPDPALERRLLLELLERDHAYRTGTARVAWRPSSLACDLGSGFAEMSLAAGDFEAPGAQADVAGHPPLDAVADWLAYPAVLRTLRAHSDGTCSVFGRADVARLDERCGGAPWSWTPRGAALEPSLAAASADERLDWFLLHSLWRCGAVDSSPAFYVHTGCHGISPPGANDVPFDDPRYGRRQGAEALLFFGRGLALVGRSKVFYDEPRGFAQTLAEGATFGAAWARYHDLESRAERWGAVGGDIGRKRAYFWSVLGDWTLRLSSGAPAR